ncbi:hypothetical protein [Hyalangium rubrum]|uniref:Lipoprotein n=1 Tax=Hyalangium rubrum TaxID=3103134 RepID=A0ABU5HJT3_9BACT|nr:hypothetical protein [Hyalangium sp. s54d21]MDY7232345.1 hypothetical protein [Hyalangium sp. s54d21]
MSLRRSLLSCCMLLTLLWTSCGDGGRGISYASSYREKSNPMPAVPGTPSSADTVVRPDLMVVSFSFWKDTASVDGVVPALKAAVEPYVRTAQDTTKAELAVRMRGVGVQPVSLEDNKVGRRVSVHGSLEVTLPPTLDYWGRAELMTALLRVGDQARAAAEKAGLGTTFSEPAVQLKNPEAHRAELMKRWVEQAQAFAAVAQGDRPLRLANCAPPGAVEQQVVTLEEVVLKLAMNCQLEETPAAK